MCTVHVEQRQAWAVGVGRWAVSGRRWAVDVGRWAADVGRWAVDVGQSGCGGGGRVCMRGARSRMCGRWVVRRRGHSRRVRVHDAVIGGMCTVRAAAGVGR